MPWSSRACTALWTLLVVLMVFNQDVRARSSQKNNDEDFLYDTFPEGFLWGCATSSYQIEGGWNADGKGENIWDKFAHEGNNVANNDTGDVACDSYNRFQEDINLLSNMKVNFYRFSLSWARILPTGRADNINQAGIDYYNNLIDGLLAAGVTPMVTLYHWDLPQALQEEGGWENEDMVMYFKEYADVAYKSFADRVQWWLTFNEPFVVTWLGYGVGVFAPGVYSPDIAVYTTAHNIIKSHAEAYHLYREEYYPQYQGRVSITLDTDWKEPYSDSPADILAAERAMQFKMGWYAHPIFVNGDYPQMMKAQVAMKSAEQGLNESRLPEFTEEEKARIQGTHDYFGLNHYTTQLIRHVDNDPNSPSWEADQDLEELRDPSWPTSGSEWLRVVPWGLKNLLVWLKNEYGNQELVITENGMSDRNATLNDTHRVYYYKHYINNVLKAIKQEDCNVIAYTAWSLMDNFEWAAGYDEKFGLHLVDFNDPERKRTPKESALYYGRIIEDNGFPPPEGTDNSATLARSSIAASAMAAIVAFFLSHGL